MGTTKQILLFIFFSFFFFQSLKFLTDCQEIVTRKIIGRDSNELSRSFCHAHSVFNRLGYEVTTSLLSKFVDYGNFHVNGTKIFNEEPQLVHYQKRGGLQAHVSRQSLATVSGRITVRTPRVRATHILVVVLTLDRVPRCKHTPLLVPNNAPRSRRGREKISLLSISLGDRKHSAAGLLSQSSRPARFYFHLFFLKRANKIPRREERGGEYWVRGTLGSSAWENLYPI